MATTDLNPLAATYPDLLRRFCTSGDATVLSEAAALVPEFIATGIAPMNIKDLHEAAVAVVVDPEDTEAQIASHRFLLEILFAYGAAYGALSERLMVEADEMKQARADFEKQAEEPRLALLADVSHELGSPLMVVKANVGSIRRFLEERGHWSEDLDQRQSDIDFAVERMMALRDELLVASRNEQRELDVMELPLVHVLRRVVRWAKLNAAEKSIQLTEEYAPDLPYVMADDGALQSVATNLLSNAVRYTRAGGSVIVKAFPEDGNVVLEVTDTGIGMSEEDQLRVYERFYRSDEAKKAAVFGVGLGLAITRDLVTSMAGSIEVRSQIGVGSTFKVILPAAPPPQIE